MKTSRSQLGLFLLVVCLSHNVFSQQVVVQKQKLAKNITPATTHSHVTVNGVVYQNFLIDLQLGLDVDKSTPPQKSTFALDFNSDMLLAQNYDATSKTGFNFTSELGFDFVKDGTASKSGSSYSASEFRGWIRMDTKQIPDSKVPKTTIILNKDTTRWRNLEQGNFGLVGFARNSHFFQSLVNTYKPEQGDSERIPISWSLSPKNEDHLFDSRANFFGNTFVINGFRTSAKQFGMKSEITNGVWYYPTMDFKMGSKWSAYRKTVCIDPNADTFISLPTLDYTKVSSIIQDDVCSGNGTSACDYSKGTISNMTSFEISFESASQLTGLGQVAPPPFKPHISLKGSDVIKKNADNVYLRKGITDSSVVRSVCLSSDIILGRWFLTKAELSMWLNPKDSSDIVLSFAEIETANKKQKDDANTAAAGSIIVLIIILAIVGCVVIVGGVFTYIKKMGSGASSSNYHTSTEDTHDISTRTFDGKH